MNEHRASWMVDSLGVEQQVWRSSKPLDEAALGFMFHKKWQVKMAQVNNALADIKRSGELNTIIQTNIHPTLKTIVKTD